MNIEDFKYHNYPSSLVRRYGVYTLDDNKEGIDKYVFDLKNVKKGLDKNEKM